MDSSALPRSYGTDRYSNGDVDTARGNPADCGSRPGANRIKLYGLLAVLMVRKLEISSELRARILSCTDLPTLERWVTRAATAASAADVVES